VAGDRELPFEPAEKEGGTHNSQNEQNMFLFKGKSSNVFNIRINYPPNEDEKEDIKRLNTEDIFPDDIAAPDILDDERCEHGNSFSPKVTAANLESRNVIIHHTQTTKDSRNGNLQLMFLRTEGELCACGKYFTGENKHLLRVSPIMEKNSRDYRPVHSLDNFHGGECFPQPHRTDRFCLKLTYMVSWRRDMSVYDNICMLMILYVVF